MTAFIVVVVVVVVVEDLFFFSFIPFKTKVRVPYRKTGFGIVSIFSGCR